MAAIGSDGVAFVDGGFVPAADARVSVFDRGFLWGDGVYEITPCFRGRPFRLDAHLERLRTSLGLVGIAPPRSDDDLRSITEEVVARNGELLASHAVCRLGHWVTRGVQALSTAPDGATLVVLVQPAPNVPSPEAYAAGVDLALVDRERPTGSVLDPRAKTTSRMNPILAEREAAAGGRLALMRTAGGLLAEGPTFNVFLVRGGALATPRIEHVLPGITRRTVLELSADLGMSAAETDLTEADLLAADEIFVTASTWGVLPVRSVDAPRPWSGAVGPVTGRLVDALAERTGFHPVRDRGGDAR